MVFGVGEAGDGFGGFDVDGVGGVGGVGLGEGVGGGQRGLWVGVGLAVGSTHYR